MRVDSVIHLERRKLSPLPRSQGNAIVVTFDSLDSFLPNLVRHVQDLLVHLICAAALLGLGWLMSQTAMQFIDNGETTAQLGIPKAPFIFGMAGLCAISGLLHLRLCWDSLRGSAHAAHANRTL